MSYANHITRLCELAFRDYARGAGLSEIPISNIFAGFDDEQIVSPRVVFNCDNAEPDGPADDATWACQLEINVSSVHDDNPARDHHDLVSEVFSQFMAGRYTVPDLVTAAAAAANPTIPFSCFDLLPGSQIKSVKERSMSSSMIFRVICCGTPST